MHTLEVADLSVSYDHTAWAVQNCSFSIRQKQIVSLVGESGSGKSTLLHGILGLLPSGTMLQKEKLLFMGRPLEHLNSEKRKAFGQQKKPAETGVDVRQIRGDEIAMIFQNAGRYMNPTQTIGKQYQMFLKSHGHYTKSECYDIATSMFEKLHLKQPDRVYHSYPFELSGGMCQRAAIAMAMTRKPRLLLADEPTSALDVTVQAQVVYLLQELRDLFDTSILLVTHNMGVAAYLSDQIGVMKEGEMVEWNTAKELISHPTHSYTKRLLDAVIELEDPRFVR